MSYNEDFASLLEMVLDEGEQAEAYKAKKAAEKEAAAKEDAKYDNQRSVKTLAQKIADKDPKKVTSKDVKEMNAKQDGMNQTNREMINRQDKSLSTSVFDKDYEKNTKNFENIAGYNNASRMSDAASRHARRHPQNESYEGLSELESLRLMNEGVEDPFLLESCNFDMALYESARKDAHAVKTSEDAKKVKELMKESKKLAKSDPKAAIAKNKEAIKLLEKLKKDAQDIDDDTMGEYYANLIPGLASVVVMAFIPATAVTAWASVGIAGIIYDCIILGDLTKAETAIQAGLTKNKKPENKDDANKIGYERAKTVYYFNNMIKTLEKANEKLAEKAKAAKAEKK